ncbi:MAG: hypothetical protein FD128_573 [Hyphomonadaceae bacterium]|nr:MAG: hypothetical protein FD128_573 [Hyphomonadaceae bacterium]
MDFVIELAELGLSFEYIVEKSEENIRTIYPQSNNAVANGAISVAALWFGGGDFWRTINLAAKAADYSDSDCNAAFTISVIAAMRGMACLPPELVAQLNDRVIGEKMNGVIMTPPVDEKISELARRSAMIGEQIIVANNGRVDGTYLSILPQAPITQAPEPFALSDLMEFWNPEWSLVRAGFGGAIFGGSRGGTYLDGDVLATFPQDFARGLYLGRKLKFSATPILNFEVAAEPNKAWELNVFVDNLMVHSEIISGAGQNRNFKQITINMSQFANQEVTIRFYQKIANINDVQPSTAYWRNLSAS